MGHGTVGVLALQGSYRRHAEACERLGASVVEVRTPADLERVDRIVLPGGESTTMSRLLVTSGLFDPLARRLADGMPAFGTCAGMILLATDVADGRADQRSFAAIDIGVRRNGYGRQVDSFVTELDVRGLVDGPFHAVFIRAPVVERVGPGVQVLASHDGSAVLARSGAVAVAAFHPELAHDDRVHEWFLEEVN